MSQVLAFWAQENAGRYCEVSAVTWRMKLPQLPGPVVTLLRSTAGSGTVCRGFLPCSPFQSSRILPSQVVGFHPPLSGVVQLECGPCSYTTQAWLLQNCPCCAAWSRKEHTGLLPVARFLDGELLSDLGCTLCHPVARLSGKAYPA